MASDVETEGLFLVGKPLGVAPLGPFQRGFVEAARLEAACRRLEESILPV
ncbi:MAG: hypothetical protein IH788_01885 [Nitrospinae bacterium]|nr:hypothetical protein [Nitrospinota bacterium]